MVRVAASATPAVDTVFGEWSSTPRLHLTMKTSKRRVEDETENTWEFYEWGVWKATSPSINRFLEEQYLLGVPGAGTGGAVADLKADGTEKYEWNFHSMLQRRKHLIEGQWREVKSRSIRRIRVLIAPEDPRA